MALKSFPYPVLGNGDDIDGEFSFTLDYTLEPKEVILDLHFTLFHETIQQLVAEDKARFIVEVSCKATFFREVFESKGNYATFTVAASDLRGQVAVSAFICTTVDVAGYDPANVHPDLSGGVTDLAAGELLADGGTGSFVAEKDFDPMRAPISSFMRIREGSARTGPALIEYQNEKILIQLAKDDYAAYQTLRGWDGVSGILHAAVVLPVLIDTLHLMQSSTREYQDYEWYGRIQQICNQKQLNMSEPLESAQKLLALPLTRSFRGIKKLAEVEVDV
jgi:hypothetical protein